MSQNTSLLGRTAVTLAGSTQAGTHFVLVVLGVLGIALGTIYHTLGIGAQSDPVQSCISGCASMTCAADLPAEQLEQCTRNKASCTDGCATMGTYPSGGTQGGSTGGTCDQQPNWPDCAAFSCTSGNWTCTSMKSTTAYPSGGTQGGYPSGGMSAEQCSSGCNSMTGTEEQKTMCRNGCNSMGSGMYPSGPYNGGMSVDQCKASCGSDECRRGCDSMGQTGGNAEFDRCFFSKYETGDIGYSVDCKKDGTDCYKFGKSDPNGGPFTIPTGMRLKLDAPSSCFKSQSAGGTMPNMTTPSGGMTNEQCIQSCAQMTCSASLPADQLAQCMRGKTSCTDGCANMGSYPGGTQGGYPSGGSYNGSTRACGPNEFPTAQNPCMFNPMGSANPMSGGFSGGQEWAPPGNQGGYYQGGATQGGNNEEMRAKQEAMMNEQQARMFEQMKNEGARQCQRFLDPLQSAFNMPKAMQDTIKGYHQKCLAGVKIATSPEEFYRLMESLRTEMTGLFEKTAGCDGVESFIRGMEQGAVSEAPRFIKQIQGKNPTLASQMENMRQETISAVDAAKKQAAGGDCNAARMTMETMEQKFESVSRSWDNGFSIVNDGAMADDFTKKMQKRGVNISAGDLQKNGIASVDHMGVMSGLMTYGGDNMATFFEDEGSANIIKTLTAGGASSEQTSLMAQIIEENKRLKEEVSKLRVQLNKTQAALADRLSALTADTKIASQIQDFVEHELANTELTPKEADNIYEAFKIENGRELVKKGLVTNIDLNLGDWYTPVVITANKEGFMKGDPTGYFRPAADMNQAEAAVTMARAFGVEVTEGTASSDPRFANYPEWSRASIRALEENGIDLSVLSAKPDQAISRSQVSILLSSILPDEASEEKSAKVFTDIGGVDQKTADAIRELSALGIANGVNNGTKYNPNGTVDRATFATYLTRSVDAAEEFLGVDAASEEDTVSVPSTKASTKESAQ